MNAHAPALRPVADPRRPSFGTFVASARAAGELVVQPRMGFGDPARMRAGLLAVRQAAARTAGTITLDSYTRLGDHAAARRALARRLPLNGYPLVAHGARTTRAVLRDVERPDFPVQVRHGSARPYDIVRALVRSGLDATEGGPVSYCLPYGRTPLRESVAQWVRSGELLAELRADGAEPHIETFGGCMLGQLCPPGMLVAISLLEGLFFHQLGLRSISLSYAQQTSAEQDAEAVRALHELAGELLPDTDWHVVLYAYMGVYPRTPHGAHALLEEAARLAVRTDAARLVVKTVAEAFRIPTVAENVAALQVAARAAVAARTGGADSTEGAGGTGGGAVADTGIRAEARALVEAVLGLHDDLGRALVTAFERGYLDIPYCPHPDNRGRTRSHLDADGRLRWSDIGSLPIARVAATTPARTGSRELMFALSYMERKFDAAPAGTHTVRPPV